MDEDWQQDVGIEATIGNSTEYEVNHQIKMALFAALDAKLASKGLATNGSRAQVVKIPPNMYNAFQKAVQEPDFHRSFANISIDKLCNCYRQLGYSFAIIVRDGGVTVKVLT